MWRDIATYLDTLPRSELDAVEVSGSRLASVDWRSYRSLSYPDFDLCLPLPDGEGQVADVVICEQVLEHVRDPMLASANLLRMLRPGGLAIINTPFLVRIHKVPRAYGDYWRFTPDGLHILLDRAGFSEIKIFTWGNRFAAYGNFSSVGRPHRRFQPIFNESHLPVVVWAYARRPRSQEGEKAS
jgi:SAM-dependent methyltransferase